ncbi:MAG TPA: hypothetical protein VLX92_01965 [Kofleriaceae bacterium]|nr:hypothetical protein [Kofleriaceae bacterium]
MRRFALFALVLAVGCGKKHQSGLDPAQDWNAEQGDVQVGGAGPANPHAATPGGQSDDPHAGIDVSGDSNGDPGASEQANPHGAGGVDVTKMGFASPDPDRPIDPDHRVRGVITVDAKLADRASPGGAVFVIAKRADASGAASGPPLAVEKLAWDKGSLPFELTDAQAMIAGTTLDGDVVVQARFDHDGDAGSKQPGDLVGEARVKIPADNVKITLDSVLP